MQEEANDSFTRWVTTDITVTNRGDCSHGEVKRGDVKLAHRLIFKFAANDPIDFLVTIHLGKVSGSKDPQATDEVAHHHEDQEKEGKLFNSFTYSHLRPNVLELTLGITLQYFEQPYEPGDLDQFV